MGCVKSAGRHRRRRRRRRSGLPLKKYLQKMQFKLGIGEVKYLTKTVYPEGVFDTLLTYVPRIKEFSFTALELEVIRNFC